MTLHCIKVENVKGASNLEINLKISPNKPSLMVAPNGFGKSSITAAFASLTSSKLKLDKDLFHRGSEKYKPKLTLEMEWPGGAMETLVADENSNTISQKLDVFVINSRLEAKATKRNMGGFTSASASLEINEVVLVSKIPGWAAFNYSVAASRKLFGLNGKILPNIEAILSNPQLTNDFWLQTDQMEKVAGTRNQAKLVEIFNKTNLQRGSAEDIQNWINLNYAADLEGIDCLKTVADVISHSNIAPQGRIEAFLAAYQICNLYVEDKKAFKNACAYNSYLSDKENFAEIIGAFDTTWTNVKPKESKGRLVVEFPNALHISNGQRDSLCFAALMQRAKKKLGKRDCILIIDEVFDYLDDANLTAVQYYVSNFIEGIKSKGNRIYPLIFTHLNPIYFKNYAFSSQKIYFLDKRPPEITEHFRKFIVNRDDATIKAGVERYHLHFEAVGIDLQAEFKALGLKETWGKSETFHAHTLAEWGKYKNNQNDYDPFAICCFVRVQIEKQVYLKINDINDRQEFLNTNGTKKKLKFAENIGINVPEVCYLLGVIYNEGLHFKNNVDNSTPIVSKLENMVIRKMAREATNG